MLYNNDMGIENTLLCSFVASGAMLFGSALVLCFESFVKKNSIFLISFAAGVMLTIAFAHLLPEATALCPMSWLYVFLGFLAFYVIQNAIMFHPCHEDICKTHHIGEHKLGIMSSIGLTIHSFLDGVILAIGFGAGWPVGLLTMIAIIFHKLPDGITITSILIHSDMGKKKLIWFSLMVALATPLGALISHLLMKGLSSLSLGMMMAITAGTFIYLAAADLLPETHKMKSRMTAVFFFLGVGLISGLSIILH